MIFSAIKSRINKKLKHIKKIYQATKDGGDPSIFHIKCDGINNTLVLFHSNRNNRFGGFISNIWESTPNEVFRDDKNAFVFSLDKQKIYSYKNDGKAIKCHKNYGPCFGYGMIGYVPKIGIFWNSPKQNQISCYKNNISYNPGKQTQCVNYNNINNTYNTRKQGQLVSLNTVSDYDIQNPPEQCQTISYKDNNGYDIENPLEQKQLLSYNNNNSYDIDNSFLEDTLDYAIDYEVFQVIFE